MTVLYRLALQAFSARHRAAYGDEMVEAFQRMLAARREQGRLAALRFVVAACADAVKAGLDDRDRQRIRRAHPFGSLERDLAHSIRSLSRARGFSFVSIVSVGIGIGTVITILLFLRIVVGTPPGISSQGLVELIVLPQESLRAQVNDWAVDTWSYPDFEAVRDASTGVAIAGWTPAAATLRAADGRGIRVDTMYVSSNYFSVLGVALPRGGGFTQTGSGGEPEVVLAYRAWKNRFNADPGIIGRTIVVNGTSHVVVGVAPERFRGHFSQHRPGFELWLPLARHPRLTGVQSLRFTREVDWVQILGRLAPETSLAETNAMVSSIMAGTALSHPATNRLKSASVEPYYPMGARRRHDAVTEAAFLAASAAVVLLVVCLNLSGMVLVRSASRERELAVRLAIGASRRRLMQYLLSEALVLALLGGTLALAVIVGIPAALSAWAGTELDEFGQLTVDGPALLVVIGLCLATSFVFGLLPALRFSRPKIMSALKDDAGGGRRVGRVHRWAVAIQAGLAVPFLVVGGLQLDQFRTTASADLGFEPAGLYAVALDLPAANQAAGDAPFVLRSVQETLARANGVTAVGLTNGLPLDQLFRRTRVTREDVSRPVHADTIRVSPGYLETLGVSVTRGRGFTADDRSGTELVVLITQALASQLFPDGDALGQRLTFALGSSHLPPDVRWPHQSMPASAQAFTVIGVTADVVDAYLGPPGPQVFVPLAQHPAARVYVVARSAASPPTMATTYERAVTGLYADPDVIAANIITGERLVRRARSELIMGSALSAVAAGAALLLAALGIFGVVGFMVATRRREIGIRIALGASRARVLRGVLTDAGRLAAWGVVGGLGLAVLWGQAMTWSDVDGLQALIYALAACIALGVAVVAALPAARQAAAVEPVIAMRAQ